jgi:hypothetical protein
LEIKVADEVWIACALLHNTNPQEQSFSTIEIANRVLQENIYGSIRPGIQVHIATHCIANMPAQPNKCRMLYRLPDGRKRLFKDTDDYHPSRQDGKTIPDQEEIPQKYVHLLNWYKTQYNQGKTPIIPPPSPIPVRIISLTENQLKDFTYSCPKPMKSCKNCELFLEEDKIKMVLGIGLSNEGWIVKTSMGKKHGVDIVATNKENDIILIEAKGEGSRNPMRVNYFLGALGELLQKMDSPTKHYGIAVPAHRQYANLIIRLPEWIKHYLKLRIYLIKQHKIEEYVIGYLEY